MKRNLYLFIMLFCAIAILKAQTQLTIHLKDGTVTQHFVLLLQQARFAEAKFLLQSVDGTEDSYFIAEIQKIVFNNDATTTEIPMPNNSAHPSVHIFPNPATDFIFINTTSDRLEKIELFRIDGKLVLQTEVTTGQSIDVSNLATGFYIVRLNNQAFKLYKR